jgi:phospholipid transport system transporter-binding protein
MTRLALPAVATLAQAQALEREVDDALGSVDADGLHLDASALTEFDTSAIALLLHAQRAAAGGGVRLRVTGAPDKLRALAQLYGVEELLPLATAAAT